MKQPGSLQSWSPDGRLARSPPRSTCPLDGVGQGVYLNFRIVNFLHASEKLVLKSLNFLNQYLTSIDVQLNKDMEWIPKATVIVDPAATA